jgi:hypothetical protein
MKGVDVAIRYENLQEDFVGVKTRLNLPASVTIQTINTTAGREGKSDYRSFYDDRARSLVSEFFAEEIAQLKYKF